MHRGLSSRQVEQFHDDGFLIVRDLLPREACQPVEGRRLPGIALATTGLWRPLGGSVSETGLLPA